MSNDPTVNKGLVINYGEGGLQNRRGRGCAVFPLQRGGGRKRFSHAEGGGGTKSFGVVFTQ